MANRCAIVGVGQTKCTFHRPEVDAPTMVSEAVDKALQDAGLTINDIDAVVFGQAPDAFIGVANNEKWCAAAGGALHKPMMRVHTGGAVGTTAAIAGFMHVASGNFKTVLVVGVDRIKESENAQYILNTIWDPIYEKEMELNTITIVATFTTQYMHEYKTLTAEHLAMVAVKNRENAIRNPYAHLQKPITFEEAMKSPVLSWPLKLSDCCPSSDGACAVIIASEERAKKMSGQHAWINGVSSIGDTVFVGDRLTQGEARVFKNMDLAASRAYKMAGITNPRKEIDVAEIYNPFTVLEIMAYERFGFCDRGEGPKFIEKGISRMDGELPISPSGGTLCSNPIAAAALYRVADAANQVRGKAGPIQVPDVKNAIGHGSGGALQFNAVMILGKDPC